MSEQGQLTYRCRFCETASIECRHNFGKLPPCNRYLRSPNETEVTFNLTIGGCVNCGLIQLVETAPSDEVRSRFDWIRYNEPQGHLKTLVDQLSSLPNIGSDSLIGAIVFGHDTTLEWFHRRGFTRTWRIDTKRDLGIVKPNAGVETIQQLNKEQAIKISEQTGKFDLLIVRHILEHAHDPMTLADALHTLVKPQGYVVFEVPDTLGSFESCDYTILWEEHISYFNLVTFNTSLHKAGFQVIDLKAIPPSLVAVARPKKGDSSELQKESGKAQENTLLQKFVASFPKVRTKVRHAIQQIREQEGKLAFFGAGHLGCIYINLMELNGMVEFVVDDDVNKRDLWMPGSRLPIRNTDCLTKDIRVCLSALSENAEKRISEKHQAFQSKHCRFLSIFPHRANSLVCV